MYHYDCIWGIIICQNSLIYAIIKSILKVILFSESHQPMSHACCEHMSHASICPFRG